MQQQGGFDAYLGSETENVADIFSRSESSDDLQPCGSDLVAKIESRCGLIVQLAAGLHICTYQLTTLHLTRKENGFV